MFLESNMGWCNETILFNQFYLILNICCSGWQPFAVILQVRCSLADEEARKGFEIELLT